MNEHSRSAAEIRAALEHMDQVHAQVCANQAVIDDLLGQGDQIRDAIDAAPWRLLHTWLLLRRWHWLLDENRRLMDENRRLLSEWYNPFT